jgi:hypothetical protein
MTYLDQQFNAAAVNLYRLDAWWTGTSLAPTRTTYCQQLVEDHQASWPNRRDAGHDGQQGPASELSTQSATGGTGVSL